MQQVGLLCNDVLWESTGHYPLGAQDFEAILGIIPSFLNLEDERPAKEQIAEHYISGWRPMEGFQMINKESYIIQFKPDMENPDEPMKPYIWAILRTERILVYRSAWVMIMKPDDSFEISRLD